VFYGLSPFIGRIFDAYGGRAGNIAGFNRLCTYFFSQLLLPLSTVATTSSLLMLSLAQEGKAYQALLSHGILFGIGGAFVYVFLAV